MLQERESLATLGIEGWPCPRCRGPTREDGEAVQHLGAGTFPPPDNGYGLRAKLGEDAARPTWIFNERGVGYRMPRPEEPQA